MAKEYYTTLEEVTNLVYDTDMYEKVKAISAARSYEISYVFNEIVNAINTHYSGFLKQHSMKSERRAYLIDRIEAELEYYQSHS